MTYQQKLDTLSNTCEQKANAFVEALSVHDQYSAQVANLKSEWEAAEQAHMYCCNFLRSGKVDPNDIAIY